MIGEPRPFRAYSCDSSVVTCGTEEGRRRLNGPGGERGTQQSPRRG